MERETETPETTMDAVPPTPGGSNGHNEHSEHDVKAEEVEEALREPQNTHPRKAADAACVLIKLANVAAHAGHKQAAACLLRLGAEQAASKLTLYWSATQQGLVPPPPELPPTGAAAAGTNVNLVAQHCEYSMNVVL